MTDTTVDQQAALAMLVEMKPASSMASFDEVSPQQAMQDLGRCPFTRPDGVKVLAKRDDIVQFNRHPAVRSTDGVHFNLGSTEPLIPLDVDGAEQKLYRKLLDPLFSPKAVEPIRPRVRERTDELIDSFITDGEVEAYSRFCLALPSSIFVDLLGLPQSDVPVFVRFKYDVIRPEGNTEEEQHAFKERAGDVMREYLDRVFDEREAGGDLGDDLIGGFLRAEVDGRRLTRSELIRIVYLLVIAGLDTVTASLSCMLTWFARHPDERAQVVADPSLLPSAVEELLRYESPVQYGNRHVTEDFELNGWQFTAGERVQVVWAAANVDPDAFDDALTVDLRRKHNAHVEFAAGPHRCLGSNLARMELVAALHRFHERIPDYWITPGAEPTYNNVAVRMVPHLPLSFPRGGKQA
jgi:cytochrome P450